MPTAVPLSKMVDLALGTPEVGAVNFNILHTLLHAMITKLGIDEVKAEVNDHDREFLSSVILKPHTRDIFFQGIPQVKGSQSDIKDRSVTSDKGSQLGSKDRSVTSDKESQLGSKDRSVTSSKEAENTSADRDPSGPRDPSGSSANTRVESKGGWDKDSTKGDDSVDDVHGTYIADKPSAYHLLEQRVGELTKAMADLNALPTTVELMAEIKTKTSQPTTESRVADMWQTMQLKKRVDANEEGVGKLMQMIHDLMKDMKEQQEENRLLSELVKDCSKFDGDDFLKRLEALEKSTDDLRKDLDNGLNDLKDLKAEFGTLPTPEEFNQFVRWGDLEDALKGLRTELDKMNQPVQQRVVNLVEFSMQTDPKPVSRPASAESSSRPGSSKSGPSDQLLEILETLGNISQKHLQLIKHVNDLETQVMELGNRPVPQPAPLPAPQPVQAYTAEPEITVYVASPAVDGGENKMDKKDLGNMSELLEELKKLRSDMQDLQDAVAQLQKMAGADSKHGEQMDDLLKKMQEDGESLKRLQQMLGALETAIDKLKDKTRTLEEDGRNKDLKIEKLFGLSDSLERKKADKEYVAMEVDVKADKKQLEGKVNHNLFDSTTAGMNRTIQDILDKLSGTGDDWKSMLAKLTNDLDGKLDRLELNPLKEWLEKKLKALSKKIKEGNLQWTDDEAAGLKKQLIQHYHCLSCDKPVNIIPTGVQPSLPASYGMPPSRSPRPYTTYELDQIRQHAKRELWEAALLGSPEQADFYATSRQCGGSHTTTMPHQRFTKVNTNHLFREEEQEDIIPIHKEELDIMGADGHIYRGRVHRLDARMPSKMMRSASANRQNNAHTGSQSPRPASARGVIRTPDMRQPSRQGSRPQSARIPQRSDLIEQRSGATTPQMDENEGEEITVDVPLEMPPVQGE